MQDLKCHTLLAVGALLIPIASRAQAPKPQIPAAVVRELATFEGDVSGDVGGVALLPNRRTLIYSSSMDGGRVTYAYDIATKRRTRLLTNGTVSGTVSPQGDQLAFVRPSEDGTGHPFLWTMPIDPKTGIATGEAQRVSLQPTGGDIAFSPDGKTIAFLGRPRSDGTWDIVLVPATGGPEHVVATYPRPEPRGFGPGPLAWSADGKSLYVEGPLGSPQAAFVRVPVTGGGSEPLFPLTALTRNQAIGLSVDAHVAFFHAIDRFFYRTASGVEGEISAALPPLDFGDMYNMTLDSSMRFVFVTETFNRGVRVLDLTTGHARDLLPGNVPSSAPAWSPDGRRLAVLSGNLSHYDITIVNADGSSPRRYPMPMHLDGSGPGVWEMPWSPDGRFLAFRATDGPKAGGSADEHGELALLDVSSGQTRVLTTSASIGRFVWRSDGKAIRTQKRTAVPMEAPTGVGASIVEIPLNGPERLLRDLSVEFPNAYQLVYMSDRTAVVAETVGEKTARFLVPLEGGATRRLPDPGPEPGLGRTGVGTPASANQLSIRVRESPRQGPLFKWVSTVGDSTRTVQLPVGSINGVALPDGKHVVVIVADDPANESVNKISLLTLDGGAPRLLTEGPRGGGHRLTPSPDGKFLAYTSDGVYTSKILEIDLGPALRALMKP